MRGGAREPGTESGPRVTTERGHNQRFRTAFWPLSSPGLFRRRKHPTPLQASPRAEGQLELAARWATWTFATGPASCCGHRPDPRTRGGQRLVVAADPVAACAGARPQVWKKRAEQQRQTVRGALLPKEPSKISWARGVPGPQGLTPQATTAGT